MASASNKYGDFENWFESSGRKGDNDFSAVDYYEWLKHNAPEEGGLGDQLWADPDISKLVEARNYVLKWLRDNQDYLWVSGDGDINNKPGGGGLFDKIEDGNPRSDWLPTRDGQRDKFDKSDYLAALATGANSWEVRNWLGQHLHIPNAQNMFDALTSNREHNIKEIYKGIYGNDYTPTDEQLQGHIDSGRGLGDLTGDIQTEYDTREVPGDTDEDFGIEDDLDDTDEGAPGDTDEDFGIEDDLDDTEEGSNLDDALDEAWDKSTALVTDTTAAFHNWWSAHIDGVPNDVVNEQGNGLNDFGGGDYRDWMQYAVDQSYGVRDARLHVAEYLRTNQGALWKNNRATYVESDKATVPGGGGFNLEELIRGEEDARFIGTWVGGSPAEQTTFSYLDFIHARSLGYTDQEVVNWLHDPVHESLRNTTEGNEVYNHLLSLESTTDPDAAYVAPDPVNPPIDDDTNPKKSNYYYKRVWNEFQSNKHWDWGDLDDSQVAYVDQQIDQSGLLAGWNFNDGENPQGLNSESRMQALYAVAQNNRPGLVYTIPPLSEGVPDDFGGADYLYFLRNPPTHEDGSKWSKKEARDFIIRWLESPEGEARTWGSDPDDPNSLRSMIESDDMDTVGTYFGDYATYPDTAGTHFTQDDWDAMSAIGYFDYQIRDWVEGKNLKDEGRITTETYDALFEESEYPGLDATIEEKARSPLYRAFAYLIDIDDKNWSGGKPRVFNDAWHKLTGPDGKSPDWKSGTGQSDRKDVVEGIDEWIRIAGLGGLTSWRQLKMLVTSDTGNLVPSDNSDFDYRHGFSRKRWRAPAWTKEEAIEQDLKWEKDNAIGKAGEPMFFGGPFDDGNGNLITHEIPAGVADNVIAFNIEVIQPEERGFLGYDAGHYWGRSTAPGTQGDPYSMGTAEGEGTLLTDLPGDADLDMVDLTQIQKVSLMGLLAHELEGDPLAVEARVEAYENAFIDRMFYSHQNADGSTRQAWIDNESLSDDTTGYDRFGLDLMRTYINDDGERVSLTGADLVEDTGGDLINNSLLSTLMYGDIDWAFYNESPEYALAKQFAGIEGAYDTIAEIRQANVYVAANMGRTSAAESEWDSYDRKFRFNQADNKAQVWARDPDTGDYGWQEKTLANMVQEVPITESEQDVKDRYSDIEVADKRDTPAEIGKPQDPLAGGDITPEMFKEGGKYAATWGDTSEWKSGTVDLIRGKNLIRKPGSFTEI